MLEDGRVATEEDAVNRKEVLNMEDLLQFLTDNNKNVKDEELQRIADNVRLVGADSDFATLHKVYKWMVDGVQALTKTEDQQLST